MRPNTAPEPVVCAAATPSGGRNALLRVAGTACREVLIAAGLPVPGPWQSRPTSWNLALGPCPCRITFAPAGRSYSGDEAAEIVLPGNPDLVAAALSALRSAGAEDALPGAFTRRALVNGRLSLDRAEAVLQLCTAPDADAAGRALRVLRAGLAGEVAAVREELLGLRALVEAGLDFVDEPDVETIAPSELAAACRTLALRLHRWLRGQDQATGSPRVCLVGPANAGKSSLFGVLTGAPALVADTAGTTRDWLEADLDLGGRPFVLIDTPGWTDPPGGVTDGSDPATAGAGLMIVCSAADAPVPASWISPPDVDVLLVATKADLAAPADPRCELAVSVATGHGLDALRERIVQRMAGSVEAPPRSREMLSEAVDRLDSLADRSATDECAAEELRLTGDVLGDLLGHDTPEAVLDRIFTSFCIGK